MAAAEHVVVDVVVDGDGDGDEAWHMFPLKFLGYGVRRTALPAGLSLPGVEEICSLSNCLTERPDGWIERWDYNRACCYTTEAAALETAEGQPGFRLFAYAFVERKLNEAGAIVEVDADAVFFKGPPDSELPDEPAPAGFASIGYDAVSITPAFMGFECSPLSCNLLAEEIPVNRHCLVDDVEQALRVAQRFDREQPEPGSYYVVQVLKPR